MPALENFIDCKAINACSLTSKSGEFLQSGLYLDVFSHELKRSDLRRFLERVKIGNGELEPYMGPD